MVDDSPAAIGLSDVSFGYQRGRPVLSSVTARLGEGRLCALIGPNAVGKTTLLRLLLGQLSPWSGRVELAGRAVGEWSASQRARLASYVPQRGLVSFAFRVEQVVAMGRFAAPPDDMAVDGALDATDLTEHRFRVFHELSAGQQQRVLLARALAQSAGGGKVMLLDEPGSAMDLWHMHRMMRTLRDKAAGGAAVLVALHDLNLAARYADEVWLLDNKRLAAAGPWHEVLTPAVLEPVYRVGIQPLTATGCDRPVFHVEPSDMMDKARAQGG